jgi:SAM-dependent methyltransferase
MSVEGPATFESPAKIQSPARIDADREFWDGYARRWTPAIGRRGREQPRPGETDPCLGDEWSGPDDLTEVLARYVQPYLGPDAVVGELGSGGGRIAARVAPQVAELHCLDISQEMLQRARATLRDQPHVRFHHMAGPQLPDPLPRFDFFYSFDVFVHLDLHTMWRYLRQMVAATETGGYVFVHPANLTTERGWDRFARQPEFTIRGHYFVCPQLMDTLFAHLPVEIVKRSQPGTGNFYENRDDLIVLRKTGEDG